MVCRAANLSLCTVLTVSSLNEHHIAHHDLDPADISIVQRGRGRPLGTGTFEYRRPEHGGRWWSISAARWEENPTIDSKRRWTKVGYAQELGIVRPGGACSRCVQKGVGTECYVHSGHPACGRCLWDKKQTSCQSADDAWVD